MDLILKYNLLLNSYSVFNFFWETKKKRIVFAFSCIE